MKMKMMSLSLLCSVGLMHGSDTPAPCSVPAPAVSVAVPAQVAMPTAQVDIQEKFEKFSAIFKEKLSIFKDLVETEEFKSFRKLHDEVEELTITLMNTDDSSKEEFKNVAKNLFDRMPKVDEEAHLLYTICKERYGEKCYGINMHHLIEFAQKRKNN